MENSNSNNNTEKKDKKIKNVLLIISIIYFLFVLEESQEASRKRFYKLLILISAIFLILTNFDFVKQITIDYLWLPIKRRFSGKSDRDDIKDDTKRLLEMTIKKNFNFVPNSSEGTKSSLFPPIDNIKNANYNYIDSYMKGNKYGYSNTNFQDQRVGNLTNYNTEPKHYDYTTTKFNEPKGRFSYDPNAFNPNYNYTPSSHFTYATGKFGTSAPYEGIDLNQANNPSLSYTGEDSGTTYRFFQELKNSKKFKSKLEQFDILALFNDYSRFENSRQFALDGENFNVNRLIENIKKYFVEEQIPYILNYHFENFDKINKIFTEALKIQMSSCMQEEIDPKVFKEDMFKIIHDSYLNFPTEGMFDFFSGKNQNLYGESGRNYKQGPGQLNEYANTGGFYDKKRFEFDNKVDRNSVKFCFFFGDNKKIKMLIQIIDSKLFLLMKNRMQQGQQGSIGRSGFEKGLGASAFSQVLNPTSDGLRGSAGENLLNTDETFDKELNKLKIQNPLLKKNKYNLVFDYSEAIAKNNYLLENNLKFLRFLLESRLEINDYLLCSFIKIHSLNNYYINLEYAVQRLVELQKDKLSSYKNDCGGRFMDENWISAFPTDSQLLFSIFLKFLEKLWNDKNQVGRSFLISFPLSPVLDENENNIFFYQTNDSQVEPHLNIIYRSEMLYLPSGRDNLFEAIVYFLMILKNRSEKLQKKLNIEDFTNSILKS